MGLIDKIKNDVKKAGTSKSKFTYVKDGEKVRVRFLNDMDDGMEIVFHDSFEKGINVPCLEHYNKDCPYCEDEELKTRSHYIWSVWNYEAKEVQLFMFKVNSFTPIPALMAMYENYGTITDRDYIIQRSGKQTNTSYSVIPMDKVKFRNEKAKPFSESQILKMIAKAYPWDDKDDDDDYEEKPVKKSKTKKKIDLEEDDDIEWNEPDDSKQDYSDMSAKELFKLCKERDLDVVPKKSEKYYINILKEADQAKDDWDDEDEDDEDEWEDD